MLSEKRIEESATNELDQNPHEVSTSAQNYKREQCRKNEQVTGTYMSLE